MMYLDIVLLVNFLFNLMILLLTKYLSRINIPLYRLLAGSLIATCLVPIVLYFPNSFFNSVWGKVIYSVCIIIVTFGIIGFQQMMKQLFLFYFISFSIGGGLFALHFLIQNSFDTRSNKLLLYVNNVYGDEISLMIILLGFPLVWLFTKKRMDRHVKDKIKYDQMYECEITLNGSSLKTTGYIDSGNHLVDSLTNRPVIICDAFFLKQFFLEKDWDQIRTAIDTNDMSQFPECMRKKISIIPFQGVGGNTDFLYTVRPDKLKLFYGSEIIEATEVLIGIQLADLTADKTYHCLLHPQIIYFSTVRSA